MAFSFGDQFQVSKFQVSSFKVSDFKLETLKLRNLETLKPETRNLKLETCDSDGGKKPQHHPRASFLARGFFFWRKS
jgi:hypothetical protein